MDTERFCRELAAQFAGAADLNVRTVRAGGADAVLYFIDGLADGAQIADTVLRPLALLPPSSPEDRLRAALTGPVWAAVAAPCTDAADAADKLVNGFCVLVLPGAGVVAYEVKAGPARGISPPEVENTAKGPKDAFTETLRTNTALLRRHLRSPALRIWETTVGAESPTRVAVLWLDDRADPAQVQAVRARLEGLALPALQAPAALEEALTGSRTGLVPLIQTTERTDRFAGALLGGRIGVFADGLPVGWLLPVCLGTLMEAAEDRVTAWPAASLVRVLRYAALGLALTLPALYIAMATFHQELIPTALLGAMIESKQAVPFPSVLEVLGLLAAFEVLQEAGTAMPQTVAQSVSIIGGLVVGTAAVEADLISPSALIAVAAAGICGFALPGKDLADAVRVARFGLAILAAIAGLFGLTLGLLALAVRLSGLESLGRCWLEPFSRLRGEEALLRKKLTHETGDTV